MGGVEFDLGVGQPAGGHPLHPEQRDSGARWQQDRRRRARTPTWWSRPIWLPDSTASNKASPRRRLSKATRMPCRPVAAPPLPTSLADATDQLPRQHLRPGNSSAIAGVTLPFGRSAHARLEILLADIQRGAPLVQQFHRNPSGHKRTRPKRARRRNQMKLDPRAHCNNRQLLSVAPNPMLTDELTASRKLRGPRRTRAHFPASTAA